MMDRHLTDSEKVRIIRDWEKKLSKSDYSSRGDTGLPDRDIIHWCQAINRLSGVCTLQSCAGHSDPNGYVSAGHLWLRFSTDVSDRFHRSAMDLASQPGMERVSVLFSGWGQEIAELIFQGNERGHLEESASTILAFLRGITTVYSCSLPP